MSERTSDWAGQALALLLVGGLIGLVVWFAKGYERNPDTETTADGGRATAQDATDDADATRGDAAREPFVRTGLHTALFGAVVDEVDGLPYAEGEGCVLAVFVADGPRIQKVRLSCHELSYESPMYDEPTGELVEAFSEFGPVYSIRYTSPSSAESDARRLSVDTSRGTMVLMGAGRLRLRVESFSVARPGEPLTGTVDEAPTPVHSGGADCHPAAEWTGMVYTSGEELEPLTLGPASDGSGVRLELFDARAEIVTEIDVDCEAGTAIMSGESSHYEGRFGPDNATILGRATLNDEPALFWLRR